MKIKVGKYYLDGNGIVRYVSRFNADDYFFPYVCDGKNNVTHIKFTANGSFLAFNAKKSKNDLVKEITKENDPQYFI